MVYCINNIKCKKFKYSYFFEGPVDGGWGEWALWSACSKTCGGGTKTRDRGCDNPAPAYGGVQCDGENSGTDSCNNDECKLFESIIFIIDHEVI